MIILDILGEKFSLPESWDDITLGDFQKISKIRNENDIENSMELIHFLTNIHMDVIRSMDISSFREINNVLLFLYGEPVSLNEKIEDCYIGEDRYIMKDFTKLNMGDYISLETILDNGKEAIDNMHLLLAILMKKEGEEELNYDTLDERGELFKKMPFPSMNKIIIFFYLLENLSLNHMKVYLEKEEMMLEMMTRKQISKQYYQKSMSGFQL